MAVCEQWRFHYSDKCVSSPKRSPILAGEYGSAESASRRAMSICHRTRDPIRKVRAFAILGPMNI
jgi:hypothetical protein